MKFALIDLDTLYAKDPNLKREDVVILEKWIKDQPHLESVKDAELQAALFLHSCYYDVDFAKKAIDHCFTQKSHHPDLFDAMSLDDYKKTLTVGCFNVIPQRTPENYAIMFIKLLDPRTENFNIVNLIRALTMTSVLRLYVEGFAEGIVVIFDLKMVTLGHLPRLNLMALKRGLFFLQEAAPIRLKTVHFINTVPFMDKIIGLVKPFLKRELYNMLNFHSSLESLSKHVPIECLPEEYGGNAPSIDKLNEETIKIMENNFDFFTWYDVQKTDESKRTGKERNGRIFGLHTSFKKLEID